MDIRKFSQEEVNRIVTVRVKRERERLIKEFDSRIKRCMASIHLMLHQEMCALKRELAAEAAEELLPAIEPQEAASGGKKRNTEGGERL